MRLMLLVVLLIGGAAAAWFLYDIDRQARGLQASRQELGRRVSFVADLISRIGATQQAYVAPGQASPQRFEEMSSLLRELYDNTSVLAPLLRSSESPRSLQAVTTATERLIAADARARENLRLGQPLMAADVIFSDGRSTLETMSEQLRDLRTAEANTAATMFASLANERWGVLGSVAVLWIAGLMILLASPARSPQTSAGGISAPAADATPAVPSEAPASPTDIDLPATAELCTALSRVTAVSELPSLLDRAARILDASGIILWMGAGDELFAVTAHGYRRQIIAALGPITRTAENATAAAWRTGQVTTVAGGGAGNGAIVAPMFGPDSCIGVLAIEVRRGRELDAAHRSVAALIAAQLATAVSAWPAASTADQPRSAAV